MVMINITPERYKFMNKLLQNDEVQKIGMDMNEDDFVWLYEKFDTKIFKRK